MMAGLFALFSIAMALIYWGWRTWAMVVVFMALGLSLLMFWHHATDILKINL